MSRELRVLITGMGCPLGHSIYKAAAAASLKLEIVAADADPRSVGLYLGAPAVLLPFAREPGFVAALIELLRRDNIDALLVGTLAEMQVVADARAQIEAESSARVLIESPEVIAIANDKYATAKALEQAGLSHARSALGDDAPALEGLATEAGFPLFAKPRVGSASRGATVLRNAEALAAFVGDGRPEWVVQEYLGDGRREYTTGVYKALDGRTVDVMSMWRDLQFGLSYKAEVRSFPEIDAYAVRVADAVGATGPCNVQSMLTDDRGPVCFEVNPRLSSTSPIRAAFGLNEVELLLRERVLGEQVTTSAHTSGWAFRSWQETVVPFEEVERVALSGT